MDKKALAEEIIDFSSKYRLFNNAETMNIDSVAEQLNESWFVEHLIHTIIVKARYKENVDNQKLKELLLEFEKVRLDLEYRD